MNIEIYRQQIEHLNYNYYLNKPITIPEPSRLKDLCVLLSDDSEEEGGQNYYPMGGFDYDKNGYSVVDIYIDTKYISYILPKDRDAIDLEEYFGIEERASILCRSNEALCMTVDRNVMVDIIQQSISWLSMGGCFPSSGLDIEDPTYINSVDFASLYLTNYLMDIMQ